MLYTLNNVKTRSVCPENPSGAKGSACMSEPLEGSSGERLGKGWKSRPFITMKPHSRYDLCDIKGMGEIVSMWITGEVDRGLIFRIYWDDSETPAVEAPLTEFFCYGFAEPHDMAEDHWNKGPYYTVDSALMSVASNRGFSSYIPMPYRKRARMELENRSSVSKSIFYQINFEEKEIPGDAGYFHAQFRMSMPVPYMGVHTLLENVQGKGCYLGTSLYVGLNRTARWWGEGEFKFYLDGDKEYPTIATTGLEDYFLGAFNWDCMSEYRPYSHLYAGMNMQKPDGLYQIQQRFCLYRWHVKDPIRFDSDLTVTVQALGWNRGDDGKNNGFLPREDDYLSVSYFYLDKPSAPLPKLPSHEVFTERW